MQAKCTTVTQAKCTTPAFYLFGMLYTTAMVALQFAHTISLALVHHTMCRHKQCKVSKPDSHTLSFLMALSQMNSNLVKSDGSYSSYMKMLATEERSQRSLLTRTCTSGCEVSHTVTAFKHSSSGQLGAGTPDPASLSGGISRMRTHEADRGIELCCKHYWAGTAL